LRRCSTALAALLPEATRDSEGIDLALLPPLDLLLSGAIFIRWMMSTAVACPFDEVDRAGTQVADHGRDNARTLI
jgi:hypothetical protein